MQTRTIWLDGELRDPTSATLPFLTAGLHYGIGVFEGIRCYETPRGPGVFRLREHLERLERSARILGWMALPYSIHELTDAVFATLEAEALGVAYIRPLVFLGSEGWNLSLRGTRPHVGIAAWAWAPLHGTGEGMRAVVSSFARLHPGASMTKAKIAGNYVNSVLAKSEALRAAADEAIMLDPEGYVAECTGANVFLVRDRVLVTPPPDSILEGITRETVITIARDQGFEVRESRVSRDHLYGADEVFACGTAAEIAGIVEIDGRPVGAGRTGDVTASLQRAYRRAVTGEHPRSSDWITHAAAGATT